MTASTASAASLHGIEAGLRFLQAYPPFDSMAPADLQFLLSRARLRFLAADEVVIAPEDGPVQAFYIVKQGHIQGEREQHGETRITFEIGVGECFPLAALVGERATRTRHRARVDTFCYVLTREDFAQLLTRSEPFQTFALRGVSHLLAQVTRDIRRQSGRDDSEDHSLEVPLADLVGRAPLTCAPELTLQAAVRQMHEAQVGSIVITDEGQRPIGIFTLRDLRRSVATGELAVADPVSRWMSPQPASLPQQATAFDALLLMTERRVAHLVVTAGEQVAGVISERDVFALQRINLVQLTREIRRARDLDELAGLRRQVAGLVGSMLAHGASAVQVTHLITQLNDHIVRRVLQLRLPAWPALAGCRFSWICFGSEGRQEQTLHTDQDNGILFESTPEVSDADWQARLLPFAEQVNRDLDALGYTWCKGNVMASNPALCLSRQGWQDTFDRLVAVATPAHLLAASIYFDARIVWGDAEALTPVFDRLFAQVADSTLFQHHLAQAALQQRPPVGLWREMLSHLPGETATLDLKVQGLTPFVDGARLLALVHGVRETATLARLRGLTACGALDPADGEAYAEAYQFLQLLRLQRHQRQQQAGEPYSNLLDPAQLNPLDRRILRESLRQAKRLQASLAYRFPA